MLVSMYRNGSDIYQYSVGEFEPVISLPYYNVPVVGHYYADIVQIEEDKLIEGNILAIQGSSIVSFSPRGDADYLITEPNQPYRTNEGGYYQLYMSKVDKYLIDLFCFGRRNKRGLYIGISQGIFFVYKYFSKQITKNGRNKFYQKGQPDRPQQESSLPSQERQ